jgi:PEGA domain
MRLTSRAVLLVLLFTVPAAADDNLLQVNIVADSAFGDGFGLSTSDTYIDTVGFSGDTIALTPGPHTVSIDYGAFSLSIGLSVTAADIAISGWRNWGVKCAHSTAQRILDWKVALTKDAGRFVLTVPPPETEVTKYVARNDCSIGSWMVVKTINVSVTSVPDGADILVNGKRVAATDSSIVLPVADREKAIYVVVRKPGFANCVRQISADAASAGALCMLRSLAPPRAQ